jgi:hypothetical protein
MSVIKNSAERNTFKLKYISTYLQTTLASEARLAERKFLIVRGEIEHRHIS